MTETTLLNSPSTAREIVYIRDDSIAACSFSHFVPQHAMKPYRIFATHELVDALLIEHQSQGEQQQRGKGAPLFRVLKPPKLTLDALKVFHSADYLANLQMYSSESWLWHPSTSHAKFSADCPPVEGMMNYSLSVAAGSLMAAALLNSHEAKTVIHWAGGMHHARCGECSGFCYVNDIVLAIVELLKHHDRVLYVDLDVHHGDGVEEAFYATDRVFTLSLHKFGDAFFPGTGSPSDIGVGESGRFYSMNVSLFDGINDFCYQQVFDYALKAVVEAYKPHCIVLQCGADSLAGDRVGVFNLSSVAHGACVERVSQLGLPLLVLGGGGYTLRSVAILWAYETFLLCGAPLPPSTRIPIDKLSTTQWLFHEGSSSSSAAQEGSSQLLLVPSDVSVVPTLGVSPPRCLQAIFDQIDRHIVNVRSGARKPSTA